MELEEQAVIFEKCRELDILVRKKFAAQMDEMEKTLQILKGDSLNLAIVNKMRSHDKSYGELLLKHEEEYKKEHQERVKRREEQFQKEEEEIKAKRTEFKSRPMFDQVQQKIRSYQ
jgi:septin family protein